jgi:YD repeat-containing protein
MTLLIYLALLASATSAQELVDWQRDKLAGPVRSIQIEFAEANMVEGKLIETKHWPHQRVIYNERGQEVERLNFNKDGSVQDRSVIRYDASGRLIGYGNVEGDRYHSTIEYDGKGNKTEIRGYDGAALNVQEVYTYDSQSRKIEQSRIADNGSHHERLSYTYNAAGQLTETAAYLNGVLRERFLKTYDGAGNLVKEVSLSFQNPGQNSTVDYIYDSHRRITERCVDTKILWSKVQTLYDANGRVSERTTFMGYKNPNVFQSHAPKPGKEVFRYNEQGKILEEAFYSLDKVLSHKTIYTYNEAGNLIEQEYLRKDGGNNMKVSYEYDEKGNWVKRMRPDTDHTGRRYIYIEYRMITYY